jgi:hypothetical protein
VSAQREELLSLLEDFYRRGIVWDEPWRPGDGTVRVSDGGGVTWIATAVVPEDLGAGGEAFRERLLDLCAEHMPPPDGRRCVVELLPAQECAGDVAAILRELRLEERVGVYSLAA